MTWRQREGLGRWANLEGDAEFEELGFQLVVVQPGEPVCMYHGESTQEDFLVVSGECVVVIEGEERRLKQWDFVHCPSMTEHVFVGAGDGPCAIVMVGARVWKEREEEIIYPVNDVAAKHGASVERQPRTRRGVRALRAAGARPVPGRRPARLPLMVSEARLETLPEGLGAEGPGWFVLNARDARWWERQGLGRWADLEGDGDFEQLGMRIAVLRPGEPSGMYHGETGQENFLVVAGECVLVIEGEERQLEGLGLRPLPAVDGARVRRGGRRAVRHRHGRRTYGRRRDPLSGERRRREAWRERRPGDAGAAEAYAPYPREPLFQPYAEGDLPAR